MPSSGDEVILGPKQKILQELFDLPPKDLIQSHGPQEIRHHHHDRKGVEKEDDEPEEETSIKSVPKKEMDNRVNYDSCRTFESRETLSEISHVRKMSDYDELKRSLIPSICNQLLECFKILESEENIAGRQCSCVWKIMKDLKSCEAACAIRDTTQHSMHSYPDNKGCNDDDAEYHDTSVKEKLTCQYDGFDNISTAPCNQRLEPCSKRKLTCEERNLKMKMENCQLKASLSRNSLEKDREEMKNVDYQYSKTEMEKEDFPDKSEGLKDADNKEMSMEKLSLKSEIVTGTKTRKNKLDIGMKVVSQENMSMKSEKENANKTQKTDFHCTEEKHEYERPEKSCEQLGLSEVDWLDQLGWEEQFLKESLDKGSLCAEQAELLSPLISIFLPTRQMENCSYSFRATESIYSSLHAIFDQSKGRTQNMLSLEWMIPRNGCFQGNIFISDFSNGSTGFYYSGWNRPEESKVINKSVFSSLYSGLNGNVLKDSITRKCKSKSFFDMLEDSLIDLSDEMQGQMDVKDSCSQSSDVSMVDYSACSDGESKEALSVSSRISMNDNRLANDAELKGSLSGDDSGFGTGSHGSTSDFMDEMGEQLEISLLSSLESFSVDMEEETQAWDNGYAEKHLSDVQNSEDDDAQYLNCGERGLKYVERKYEDEDTLYSCTQDDEELSWPGLSSWIQEDKDLWTEKGQDRNMQENEDGHMQEGKDGQMQEVGNGHGGGRMPLDLQRDPVEMLSPSIDRPESRTVSDDEKDGSKDEHRRSMRDNENMMVPEGEEIQKCKDHQKSAWALPQQNQDKSKSQKSRCHRKRRKDKDAKKLFQNLPGKQGQERKETSDRKNEKWKHNRNETLHSRHRHGHNSPGNEKRACSKEVREIYQSRSPWKQKRKWWPRRQQQSESWSRRRTMPFKLIGHNRGFSANHSNDPPIRLSSVKTTVRQHSGGKTGDQNQGQSGFSRGSNGSAGGSQGNSGKESDGGKKNGGGQSGDGDGNRKRNGPGHHNSSGSNNINNNLNKNESNKSSDKDKSIKFVSNNEAKADSAGKTQFKVSTPPLTHVIPPHNHPPDKRNAGEHNRHQLSSRGPPAIEPSLPPPVLDDIHRARRLLVEESRLHEGSVTPESAYATPASSYSPPGSTYHTSESTFPPDDPEGSQATGGGHGAEQTPVQLDVTGRDEEEDLSPLHVVMSMDQLCFALGDTTNGLPCDIELFKNLNLCMTHIMHDLGYCTTVENRNEASRMSWSVSDCWVCLILSQLMNHVANLDHEGFVCGCTQCAQIFNIMKQHAIICIVQGRPRSRLSRSDLCYKICKASEWRVDKITSMSNRLNGKVRKYCAKVLGNILETLPKGETDESPPQVMGEMGLIQSTEIPSTGLSSTTSKQSGHSLSLNGNIVTTETGDLEAAPLEETSHSGHFPVSSQLAHPVLLAQASSPPASLQPPHSHAPLHMSHALPVVSSSASVSTRAMAVMPPTSTMTGAVGGSGDDSHSHGKLVRKPSMRKQPAIPPPIVEETQALEHSASAVNLPASKAKDEMQVLFHKRYGDDIYETQRTYGDRNRYESVPLGVNFHDEEQFMSVWTRPRGVPGVGEVVFGHPSQLRKIAGFWDKKREECERTQTCPYMHREEGVILAEQKENFNILRTRYQKHQQWERVTHLGNGMSGKCHLAIDLKTNFKFCCKKIHLLRYAEEELSLWSEMHNAFIVRLYGAIRHGYKVYIFSEFFDGGSLASCIEEQKRLGRRLSHWSAINYFQQLLKVLAYLQSKNILHEDIKADNILLRRNSTHLAVTDFGTSRRLQDPKELKNKSPLGSPTHWSPEKASMEGHGFPSDLWAAVCVLVHMLSGEPPWVKRFLQKAAILNFIIYAKPPPMEDVPDNVQTVVRDLIERGFIKDPQHRPSPSELLRHQAFSILDEGTPETYFSTLVSQAQAVMPGIHAAVGASENQNQRAEPVPTNVLPSAQPESTVLFETTVSVGPCQESDNRLENREDRKAIRHGEREDNQQVQAVNNNDERDRNNGEQTGNSQKDEMKGDSGRTDEEECQLRNVVSDEKEARAGNMPEEKCEGAVPTDGKESKSRNLIESDKAPTSTLNDRVATAVSVNADQVGESQISLSRLLEPVDINNLLPVFDELFPSGDSENQQSIKSFFADDYSKSANLNAAAQVPLQEYKPDVKSGEQVPNLSIFGTAWGESTSHSNPGQEESSSSTTNTLTQPGESLIRDPSLSRLSADTQSPPLTLRKFKDSKNPAKNPLNFHLSSGSDECTSADIFDSGPNEMTEGARQSSSQLPHHNANKGREAQAGNYVTDSGRTSSNTTPVSPSELSPVASTGSNHSSSGVSSSLQQRKPTNLKLNVSGTPASSAVLHSHSQPDISTIHSASSTGLGEHQKRHTWSNMQPVHSQHNIVTPKSGSTPSTGRLTSKPRSHSGASGPNTGSSGSFFMYDMSRPNSVREEQDKCFQELQADMLTAVSVTSSGSDRLSDLMECPQESQKEDDAPDPEEKESDTDMQAVLAALQNEIGGLDESLIGGHKLHFHQHEGGTFDLRVQDWPVYWKFIIRRVRQKIMQGGHDHFTMFHMDNSQVRFDKQLTAQEFKVQRASQGLDCWCERCQTMY